jgi:acetyl-CoA carboxylase biotin carboxyl carrier protein
LDLKQIKQIIDLMKRSELSEFEVEEEGFKIKIKRGFGDQQLIQSARDSQFVQHSGSAPPIPVMTPIVQTPAQGVSPSTSASGADEAGVAYVKSPMVGTFYRSASPDSPSFVEIGTKVDEKSVVCIIEAMKIMNEIQAEAKGSIVEVLVENGQPVEYGQRLFKIRSN